MTWWWRLKGTILRSVCPLFFEKIGAGTMFTGRIRLPAPLRKVSIGRRCMIGHDVYFQTSRSSSITLGDEVSVNTGSHLVAHREITIGQNTAIGEYVSIRDQEHLHTPETGVRGQGFTSDPVAIGDNCWIGRGVLIRPGTRIGAGSIVAANSVVCGRFPDNVLIAGAPAVIKRAFLPGGEKIAWDSASTPSGSKGD